MTVEYMECLFNHSIVIVGHVLTMSPILSNNRWVACNEVFLRYAKWES